MHNLIICENDALVSISYQNDVFGSLVNSQRDFYGSFHVMILFMLRIILNNLCSVFCNNII